MGATTWTRRWRRSRRKGTEYYTLSYVPSGESDAAQPFRKIHVTVNVPGLRVVTREGYFTSEAPVSQVALAPKAKQANDVKYDLMSAARTTMPYTALHTDAKRSKNGYSVLVNANDLKFTEQPGGSRMAEVTILAVCYNARARRPRSTQRRCGRSWRRAMSSRRNRR